MKNLLKSSGKRYSFVETKVKINKKKLIISLFIFLFIAEIVLGVLWCLGY